jgi:hypothetical protein
VVFPLDQLNDFLAGQGDFSDSVAGGGGPMRVTVNLDSKPILDAVTDGTRNRQVLIDARSVV